MSERKIYILLLGFALVVGLIVKASPLSVQIQRMVCIALGSLCLLVTIASALSLRRLREEEEEADDDDKDDGVFWPLDNEAPLITGEMEQAVEELMHEWARPAVELAPKLAAMEEATAGSKIGGCPDMPLGLRWPQTRVPGSWKRHPLAFLAQLNLAELSPLEPCHELPSRGLLLFFFDMEYAYDGACRVIHVQEAEKLSRAAFPKTLAPAYRYAERSLSLTAAAIPPDWSDLDAEQERRVQSLYREMTPPERLEEDFVARRHLTAPGGIYSKLRAKVRRYQDACCESRSYLLGHPDLIQDTMAEECVTRARKTYGLQSRQEDWQLLLQLASFRDELGDVMFYDMGNLYFWIRRQDLAACDFSKVVPLVQCY